MNKNDKSILVFSSADIHNYRNWKESLVFTETYKTIDLVILAGDIQDIYTSYIQRKVFEYTQLNNIAKENIEDIDQSIYENFAKEELKKFFIELASIFPNAKFVIAPGNHDCVLLTNKLVAKNLRHRFFFAENSKSLVEVVEVQVKGKKLKILINKGISYDAYFKGNGKPCKPYKNNLVNDLTLLEEFKKVYETNPNIDIIVSHCPPYSLLDYVESSNTHIGSIPLLQAMNSYFSNTHYIICGHNHIADKTTQIERFNSESVYQMIINATCRSEHGFANPPERDGVTFSFENISKTKNKRFFERYKFFKHILRSRSYALPRSIALDKLPKCTNCGQSHISAEAIPVCSECIRNYLSNVTIFNFESDEFDIFNNIFTTIKNK
jgi:Icc-related predicted phosphoesterase